MGRLRLVLLLAVPILAFSCTGWRTHKEPFARVEDRLIAHDYGPAAQQIEQAKVHYAEKDRLLYYLDLGLLYHYGQEFQKSNELLEKADSTLEDLYSKSVSRAAASLMVNDNVLEYPGEDYEDIYVSVFKALNYLALDEFDEAFVEIRRVDEKLAQLENRHAQVAQQYHTSNEPGLDFRPGVSRFHSSALARYLSLLLYRSAGKYDDARIDYNHIQEAFRTQPDLYPFPNPLSIDVLDAPQATAVLLLCFAGRSPEKKARTLYVRTGPDMIYVGRAEEGRSGRQDLTAIQAIPWKGVAEGYFFKFQLPYLSHRQTRIHTVFVSVDGGPRVELAPIEDMARIAAETYKVKEPLIYLKSVLRTVTKGLLAVKANQEVTRRTGNPLAGFLAEVATTTAIEVSENADLRSARFFPGKAFVTEVQLPPGVHSLRIEYVRPNGTPLWVDRRELEVSSSDRLRLLESMHLD